MYAKLFTIAALVSVAIAGAIPAQGPTTCSSVGNQCCNSVQDASDSDVRQAIQDGRDRGILSNLVDVDALVGSLTAQVGVNCTPISVLAISGQNCNQQTVCCSGNNFNGVVALGCTPINVNA